MKTQFDYKQERKELREELLKSNDDEEKRTLRGMIKESLIEEYKQFVEVLYN